MYTLDVLVDIILKLAQEAFVNNEVPIASIIFSESNQYPELSLKHYSIESTATNHVRRKQDPTAHSEMEALRQASEIAQNERLPDYSLLTTLEPCLMCSTAISLARIKMVYYLSPRDKGPGLNWLLAKTDKKTASTRLNHYPQVIPLNQYAQQYQLLLHNFFQERRK